MKIGIMGAMKEEIEPIKAFMSDVKLTEYAKNNFYEGTINGKKIVLAYSKIGKVFSTITALSLIQYFKVDKILFSGVAGGIDRSLKIGDLLVANKTLQHDIDISSFGHKEGFIPESDGIYIENDKELLACAKKVAKEKGIKLKEGIIATGDQFIASQDKKDWIAKNFNAIALEMEGASVALACNVSKIPCLILRSISDEAGQDAHIDFEKFLEHSSKKSAEFLKHMLSYI